MSVRKIVNIDEKKCNGCGLCIPNCAEGAIKIIDGKAKLVKDLYCDGLGACLGHCPQDAITVIEREADEFDEKAVEEKMKENNTKQQCPGSEVKKFNNNGEAAHMHAGWGCPGSKMRQISRKESDSSGNNAKNTSRLTQWPVQLNLVPVNAPYFNQADLLITADCVPFAYANYHNDFLKDRAVVVGCLKLDNVKEYIEKLEDIIRINDLESVTVLRMEVPCCGGIASAAKTARDNSEINIPIKVVTIGIEGDVVKREYI